MCVVPSPPNPQRGLTEMGAHCRTEGLTDHISLSAPEKAAAYQCTIISCPQQMPQHHNWAIIWFSFCPKYPSGCFLSSVNIVLGPQLCNQCRWDETIVSQFALSLREYQTLSILLKSKNIFSCHHSHLLYFPYTGMTLFFSNQKSPKPTGFLCAWWQVKQFPPLQTNITCTQIMSWSEEQRQTLEGGSTHRLSFCQSKFLGVWLHQGDGSSDMLQEPAGLPGTQACKSLSGLNEEGIWNWEWATQDFVLFKAAEGTIPARSKHTHSRRFSSVIHKYCSMLCQQLCTGALVKITNT